MKTLYKRIENAYVKALSIDNNSDKAGDYDENSGSITLTADNLPYHEHMHEHNIEIQTDIKGSLNAVVLDDANGVFSVGDTVKTNDAYDHGKSGGHGHMKKVTMTINETLESTTDTEHYVKKVISNGKTITNSLTEEEKDKLKAKEIKIEPYYFGAYCWQRFK